ncbi:hypothetical protein C8E87_2037 [Paractinoplanes brasiliensis]|uniref:Uncharacterized protein n=1 Tax=Paractinoplanes brasiliensis TaxID=52695 RepID=A0A4R6JPJ4_9ACTN|nr:hypothetical protein C8E87_2037 [Actinoplanes brasiliensis]
MPSTNLKAPELPGYFGGPGLLRVSRLLPGWNRRGAPSEAAGRQGPRAAGLRPGPAGGASGLRSGPPLNPDSNFSQIPAAPRRASCPVSY